MVMNPRSLANLRPPWQAGQSGNPGGRPKRRQLDDLLELIAETGAERAISEAILKKLLEGDVAMIKEYLDRRDGKVPQPTKTEGEVIVRVVRTPRPAWLAEDDDG
jgi:hypothetical protein